MDLLSCVYMGWGLLIPFFLSLPYGLLARRALSVLGRAQADAPANWLRISLPTLLLFTAWGMVDIPLPAVYLSAYLIKRAYLTRKRSGPSTNHFIAQLPHIMTMALHMVFIGTVSLATQTPMYRLLAQPSWRIAAIVLVLSVNDFVAWRLPRWKMIVSVLRTQSESEEGKPILAFLRFCNIYLLVDSVLCISQINWALLPLFLVGSTVLLEFYLIRFLRHLYTLLRVRYLEEEHVRLIKELQARNQSAARWRTKGKYDPLTGVFSRRYIMEQASALLQAKRPLSLAFIDLDHLKLINDKDGHYAGDQYLVGFAEAFGARLRKTDIFARVGGDEFAVLLPDCPQDMAFKRMEAIREQLSSQYDPPFSFSFGVSSASENANERVEDLLRRADRAMYQDKKTRA